MTLMHDHLADRRQWLSLAERTANVSKTERQFIATDDSGMFFALAERWCLTDAECAALLNVSGSVISTWRSGALPLFSTPMLARTVYALGIDKLLCSVYRGDVRAVHALRARRSDRQLRVFAERIRTMSQIGSEHDAHWRGGDRLIDSILVPQLEVLDAVYRYIAIVAL